LIGRCAASKLLLSFLNAATSGDKTDRNVACEGRT